RGLSAKQQVYVVYLTAERGDAGGGERALHLLSARLARMYDGAKEEPALVRLHGGWDAEAGRFRKPPPDADGLVFKRGDPPPRPRDLPPARRQHVEALLPYLRGAGFGGPSMVLQQHLETPPLFAADLLLRTGSLEGAVALR